MSYHLLGLSFFLCKTNVCDQFGFCPPNEESLVTLKWWGSGPTWGLVVGVVFCTLLPQEIGYVDEMDEVGRLRKQQDEDRKIGVALFETDQLDKFWAMYATLQLEVRLMDRVLAMNEVAWQVQEMRKEEIGNRRSYPVLEIFKGASEPAGVFRQFTTACTHRLLDADLWQNAPHQESFATYVYMALSRSAAVAFEWLIVRYRGFPGRLLNIIREPGEQRR